MSERYFVRDGVAHIVQTDTRAVCGLWFFPNPSWRGRTWEDTPDRKYDAVPEGCVICEECRAGA